MHSSIRMPCPYYNLCFRFYMKLVAAIAKSMTHMLHCFLKPCWSPHQNRVVSVYHDVVLERFIVFLQNENLFFIEDEESYTLTHMSLTLKWKCGTLSSSIFYLINYKLRNGKSGSRTATACFYRTIKTFPCCFTFPISVIYSKEKTKCK